MKQCDNALRVNENGTALLKGICGHPGERLGIPFYEALDRLFKGRQVEGDTHTRNELQSDVGPPRGICEKVAFPFHLVNKVLCLAYRAIANESKGDIAALFQTRS